MEETEKILYHYTSLEGLLGIIESKSIWATNVLYLNDASELNYSLKLLNEVIGNVKENFTVDPKWLRKYNFFDGLIESIDSVILLTRKSFFTCSFSEEKDLLSQWRGYCPKGIGVSIGINSSKLIECAKQNKCSITLCNYNTEDQKSILRNLIRKMSDRYDTKIKNGSLPEPLGEAETELFHELFNEVMELAPTFKHPKFEEEKEWRMILNRNLVGSFRKNIKFRPGQSMIIPYVEISLPSEGDTLVIDKVVVGPTHESKLSKRSVEMLLKSKNVKFGEVQYSTIPYRNW